MNITKYREISLRWRSGYTDLLPSSWFSTVKPWVSYEHDVIGPDGEQYKARCRVLVEDENAYVDYSKDKLFRKFNIEQEWEIGVLHLTFVDDSRERVKAVEWRDEGKEPFRQYKPTIDYRGWDLGDDPELSESSLGAEGKLKLVTHMQRERQAGLAKSKKEEVLGAGGSLKCEACDFEFKAMYGEGIGADFCEVHHRRPLNWGERITRLKDLAVLCSNCHRMIHRTVDSNTNEILSVEDFRKEILRGKSVRWRLA